MQLSRLTLVLALALSAHAAADPKSDYVAQATSAFNAGRYQHALEALTAAIAIERDPQLLFALGQVHMKLGDCRKAIAFYKEVLATKPDQKEAAIVNKAIERCTAMKPENKPETKTEQQPALPPPGKSEGPPIVQQPPPTRVEHVPWYRDVTGDVLVLVGVAAAGVAIFEYRSALSHRDAADAAPSYNAYVDEIAASQRDQRLAIGFAAGASIFVAAGILRYVLRDSTRERATVSMTPSQRGALATWSVRF